MSRRSLADHRQGRTCTLCGEFKPPDQFYSSTSLYGEVRLRARCKNCKSVSRNEDPEVSRERARAYYHANRREVLIKDRARRELNMEKQLLAGARSRAQEKNLPFELTIDDIVIPERCPVLDIPLTMGTGVAHAGSPTLDRIQPHLGYVKGNTVVMSYRANTIKQDATPEELFKVAEFTRDWIANVG